jgi:hypothetical protein
MKKPQLEGEVIFWSNTYGFIRVVSEEEGTATTYFVHLKKCANLNMTQVPVIGTKARFHEVSAYAEGKAPEAGDVFFEAVIPKPKKNAGSSVEIAPEVQS